MPYGRRLPGTRKKSMSSDELAPQSRKNLGAPGRGAGVGAVADRRASGAALALR
jgi:hypothetical protein